MRGTTASTFPLLKLPGEIRNRIYDFCLISRRFDGSLEPISPRQPALTQISRVIRGETLKFFYVSNHFKISLGVVDDFYGLPDDVDIPEVEHQYMRLLHGIRNLVRNGYFDMMNGLTIQLRPIDFTMAEMYWCRPTLRARILKKEPDVLDDDPSLEGREFCGDLFYEVDRLKVSDIDWGDVEAVDNAVSSHKSRLSSEFAARQDWDAADDLEHLPGCGQMCEVLRTLLNPPRLNENSERLLFLYVHLLNTSPV